MFVLQTYFCFSVVCLFFSRMLVFQSYACFSVVYLFFSRMFVFQGFITTMDALKLDQKSVDEVR